MIIVLKPNVSDEKITKIENIIIENGAQPHVSKGEIQTIIGMVGDTTRIDPRVLEAEECVEKVMKVSEPYKLANRAFHPDDTIVDVAGVKVGGDNLALIAGPCSVESEEQVIEIAKAAKAAGANILRGGAFKPRTSPYDFQGLGEEGLKYMREAADKYDMLVVTEVMDASDIPLISKYADIFQVGARNMQNFSLLKALGKCGKPILLKRGLSATMRELLMAAEYIVAYGNREVILCERGIRTFETITRNTVDINAIPLLKEKSHLPIIIDASHGTGRRSLVEPVTLAGTIAGADGAMVEVHENPECATSDGMQSLYFNEFEKLMRNLKKVLKLRDELE